MNTKAVAKLLSTSPSTIQRWVKQLQLDMERNVLGHFVFSENDIELLKEVKTQLQNGSALLDISINQKKKRSGIVNNSQTISDKENFTDRFNRLEKSLNQKADSVVSYQILQHRREIDELNNQIELLTEKLTNIEELMKKGQEIAITTENSLQKEKKSKEKKGLFQQIFNY